MRITLSLIAAMSLTSLASAQTTTPEGLEVVPGRATGNNPGWTFVVRAAGTPMPVFEPLMQYDERFWQGIGDLRNTNLGKNNKSLCELKAVNVRYQDQNQGTSEAFKLVVRDNGGSATVPVAKTGAPRWTQNVPGATGTGNGAIGVLTTVQAMTPGAIDIPCQKTFYVGMEIPSLPPNTTWPGGANPDGLSILASYYDAKAAGGQNGDWPKGGNGADYLYDLILPGTRGRFSTKMVFGYNLITDAPILQVGANHVASTSNHGADHGYGAAGNWPEVDPATARGTLSHDGLVIRITDPNQGANAGVFGIYMSLASGSSQNLPIISLGGIGGGIYLGLPNFFVTTGVTKAAADTEIVLAPPKLLPKSLIGFFIYLQGYTVVNNNGHLTNMAAVQYK